MDLWSDGHWTTLRDDTLPVLGHGLATGQTATFHLRLRLLTGTTVTGQTQLSDTLVAGERGIVNADIDTLVTVDKR